MATEKSKPAAKHKATKRKAVKVTAKTSAIENKITTPRRAELGYTPSHLPLPVRDQVADEQARQAELDRERTVHNQRTGDASR